MNSKIYPVFAIIILALLIPVKLLKAQEVQQVMQMSYCEYIYNGIMKRSIVVWNSMNGESSRYWYDAAEKSWKESASIPNPEIATSEPQPGEVMMKSIEYIDKGIVKRTVFAWNTKTGETRRYWFDIEAEKWQESESIPEEMIGFEPQKAGELMFDYREYVSAGVMKRSLLVWNTSTGKSERYWFDTGQNSWTASAHIPDNPLSMDPVEPGRIGMDYDDFVNKGEINRTILVWDTKTGLSKHYRFDTGKKEWVVSGSTPDTPFKNNNGKIGEIMMACEENPVSGSMIRSVFIWNTKTGKSALYVFNEEDKTWHEKSSVPKNPFGGVDRETGDIMMNFEKYTTAGVDKGSILIWHTKTGESLRYWYAPEEDKWHESGSIPTTVF